MTMIFDQGSKPENLSAKSWGFPFIDDVMISVPHKQPIYFNIKTFCDIVEHFLYDENSIYSIRRDAKPDITVVQAGFWGLLVSGVPYAIFSLSDFLSLVEYIFTNTNLEKDDPREVLLNEVVFGKEKKIQPGALKVLDYLVNLQVVDGFPQYPAKTSRRLVDGKTGRSAFGF